LKKYIHEVFYLLGDESRKLPKLLILFWGVSIFDLAGISLIGPFVSIIFSPQLLDGNISQLVGYFGLPQDHKSIVIVLGAALLCVFVIKAISAIFINYKIISFSQYQQVVLRSSLMRSYQTLPYTEYLKRNSSQYIHSMQVLVPQFTTYVIYSGLRTISDSTVALVILIFLAWKNVLALTILVSLLALIIIIYDRVFRAKVLLYGENANKAATSMVQSLHEGIDGFKEIRVLGCENYFFDKVKDESEKHTRFIAKTDVISTAPRYILELVIISFVVIFVFVTIIFGKNLLELLPTLGIFGVASLRLLPFVNILTDSIIKLRFGRNSTSVLFGELKYLRSSKLMPQEILNYGNKNDFHSLSLNEVSFNYPETLANSLTRVSIKIKSGDTIGIKGTSGAGKTTLVDLMLGILNPTDGEVLDNGEKRDDESIRNFRRQVAYLPQTVFLIDNSLRRNVAIGVEDHDINDELIYESLEKSFLTDYVKRLPKGIDTVIGERGVRMSGGQRQRISLARAFYHKRSILIMDEATSALDNETEKEIVNQIQLLKGKITIVVIAHRLTTLQHCDSIYRLEYGKIVEINN